METHSSFSKANQTIDLVVSNGAQHLYQSYLKTKIPNHSNQQINNTIQDFFNSGFQDSPSKAVISEIKKPQQIKTDHLTPAKIKIRKSLYLGLTSRQQRLNSRTEDDRKMSQNSSVTPNQCIKYSSIKNEQSHEEMKLRVSKRKQQIKQHEIQMQKIRNQRKIELRQRMIKDKMEELNAQGIPFSFDDDGNLIFASPQQFKKNEQIKKNRLDRTIHLNYQTIDFNSRRILQPKYRSLTGRKKGFTTSKYSKKLKLSDRQFNNNHERQFSTIPFLNLSGGVKILQKGKNITASKVKDAEHTRQSYINDHKKTFFKSFIPDSGDQISALSMQTVSFDVNRPNTTDNLNRTKRTVETAGEGNSTKRSILWRPCTTQKEKRENRLKINNKELARQITVQ